MLNLNKLTQKDKRLLFSIKKIHEMRLSYDTDKNKEFVDYFSNNVKKVVALLIEFNEEEKYLFLKTHEVLKFIDIYQNQVYDFESWQLLGDTVDSIFTEFYIAYYDYLENKIK